MAKLEIPRGIIYARKYDRYFGAIKYKGVTRRTSYTKNLEDAIKDYAKIKKKVDKLKASEPIIYSPSFIPRIETDNIIPLRNRKGEITAHALVSLEDYEKVNRYRWYQSLSLGYAFGCVNGKLITMHQYVSGKPDKGKVIDHINLDKLDNRRSNLRCVTRRENNQNMACRSSSGYKGVSKTKQGSYNVFCLKVWLGLFSTAEEGAMVYDTYAYQRLGKDAKTNSTISYEDALKRIVEIPQTQMNLRTLSENKDKTLKYPLGIRKNNSGYFYEIKACGYNIVHTCIPTESLSTVLEELRVFNKCSGYDDNLSITRTKCGSAFILTGKGTRVLVDDLYWRFLNSFKWCMTHAGYIVGTIAAEGNKLVQMHRYIIELNTGRSILDENVIDHINGNKADNRLSNLRETSYSQNNHNKKKIITPHGTKYRGVIRDGEKFRVRIRKDGETNQLGLFSSENDAGRAYNEKAVELYGENACLNDIID